MGKRRNGPTGDDYRQCAAGGLTPGQTAERLGVDISTVYHTARRLSLTYRVDDGWKRRKREMDELYRECCAAGYTTGEMVKLLKVRRNTVLKRARELGLRFKGMTKLKRRTEWPSAADYRGCSAEGLSMRETAERLEVARETVRTWARKLELRFARRSGEKRVQHRCRPGCCPDFAECQKRVTNGDAVLCEQDSDVLGQPESLLWSRNGGLEGIAEYY